MLGLIPDNTKDSWINPKGRVTEMVRRVQPQGSSGLCLGFLHHGIRQEEKMGPKAGEFDLGDRKTKDVPMPAGWL